MTNTFIVKEDAPKKNICKTVVIPALAFGESGILTNSLENKIRSVEIKYLHTVLSVGRSVICKSKLSWYLG